MEQSQAKIDAMSSNNEEADSTMFAHVSHAMELYSPGRVVIIEQNQANINGLQCDHEEADSRMFAHVSHAIELYSPGGVVIWNNVKLTLMPSNLTMKKQILE